MPLIYTNGHLESDDRTAERERLGPPNPGVSSTLPEFRPGVPPQPYALRRRRRPDDPTLIRINGHVATEGDLPDPSESGLAIGDAFIVDETGDLWVWEAGPPPAFWSAGSIRGPRGPAGPPIRVLGEATVAELEDKEGEPGDAYWITGTGELYVWDEDGNAFTFAAALMGPEGEKGDTGEKGDRGEPGIPAGGAAQQRIIKLSTDDFDAGWANPEIPAGGTVDQVITKIAPGDRVIGWRDSKAVPLGGTTDQVLAKASDADSDAVWQASGVPRGGSAGQVLAKNSNTAFDVSWRAQHTLFVGTPSGNVSVHAGPSVTASDVALTGICATPISLPQGYNWLVWGYATIDMPGGAEFALFLTFGASPAYQVNVRMARGMNKIASGAHTFTMAIGPEPFSMSGGGPYHFALQAASNGSTATVFGGTGTPYNTRIHAMRLN
jgi:hypothetical protein